MRNMQLATDVLDPKGVLAALRAFRKGDFSVRLPMDLYGLDGEIAQTFNEIVELNEEIATQYVRIRDQVGKGGQIKQRVRVSGATGDWADRVETVNSLISDLVWPTSEIARVIESVARGDLSQRVSLENDGLPLRGEFLRIAKVVNAMVDQLNGFASEVSRVAREVGTEGKLGGQAVVPGVAGTWKDLTDHVNSMAANLSDQVRGIAQVVTAVAQGDLKRKMVFEAKGEIAALADIINNMIDTLATFGDQVTNVAREVGIEGRLGGQARVPGAAGLWRDLTDNVNQLAANLTNQVRAISDVATAVTKGDLTRSIRVIAMGEVAALKDNINEMIRNLEHTTRKNSEQDWLKTNVAKFSRMLQGHSDLATVSKLVLSELAPLVNAQQGVVYTQTRNGVEPRLELLASYAASDGHLPKTLRIGEGLVGQCAYERKRILLADVPDDAIRIGSVLHAARPLNIIILPVVFEGEVKAVLELASLTPFSKIHLAFLDQLTDSIGVVFNTIEANMRTEALLEQSQLLTRELQSQQQELKETNDRLEQQAQNLQNSERLLKAQQEELQSTNEQLEEKAMLLSEQMKQIEYKNREVEQAKAALEEKAEQLALSSRYKSEFLANMSHELRTPLNSLLIIANLLAENTGSNLTPKQIEYAQTIYAAGTDLLSLISDILDLAKIESGTVTLDIGPERLCELQDYVERTFRQVAQGKSLAFTVSAAPDVPPLMHTDGKRLQQILKNLLSNAFKFTERGGVALEISAAKGGWTRGHRSLDTAESVIAFAVRDTGIGITEAGKQIIFEAFQQADGTTSRKFGGTGLGLSISRELTRLMHGEIRVESAPNEGSTFTLYLPFLHDGRAIDAIASAPAPAARTMMSPLSTPFQPVIVREGARPWASSPSDDRTRLGSSDYVALIIEDDQKFAGVLLDIAHQSGFKGVIAPDASAAFRFIKQQVPDVITLDLKLPDMDGWMALDLLKHDPQTRHVPVSVISVDERMHKCLHMGAMAVVRKPSTREMLQDALAKSHDLIARDVRNVLIADGDPAQRTSVSEILSGVKDLAITVVETGAQVHEALSRERPDCIVLGETLADMPAVMLLRQMAESNAAAGIPFVMYCSGGLQATDETSLDALAEIMVVKKVETIDAVLAEATLFLHKALADLPDDRRALVTDRRKRFWELAGRKVLIIDDDIRNIFALTGAIEEHGLTVLNAENGMDGIEILKGNPDIDAVLIDIMMPEIDGYDTMRMIREMHGFRDKLIIAVTAKAMKGDREKCIEAGANEYVAKPVKVDELMSLLRVCLA